MFQSFLLNRSAKSGWVLFLIIFCPLVFQQAQSHGLKFHEFRPIDHRLGLDASAVNCVIQDKHGLIWLGTDRGLYSFDGYLARHYSSGAQTGQENDGVIYCALMVDSVHIWLGADKGLFVFNTYTDMYESAPAGLPENIRSISRINGHSFWIGSINGLYQYNSLTNELRKRSDEALPHQAIYTILRYDENTFYFGTYNGLCSYDTRTDRFDRIHLGSEMRSSNQLILSLLPDYKRGCIWIGVEGGLYSFNPSTGEVKVEPLFKETR
ncbi:MAG: two-component regulator propeller domain-containing protein [Bacteroidales bacterium]